MDHWCQKQPLNQLSHNNCHKYILLHFKTIDSHSHQLHMPSCQQKKFYCWNQSDKKSLQFGERTETKKQKNYFISFSAILSSLRLLASVTPHEDDGNATRKAFKSTGILLQRSSSSTSTSMTSDTETRAKNFGKFSAEAEMKRNERLYDEGNKQFLFCFCLFLKEQWSYNISCCYCCSLSF